MVQGAVAAAGASTDAPTWQDVVSNPVYGACFKRKTVNDLVGCSGQGDHIRQLRQLQMSALSWPVLLLEGDERLAETRALVYGASALVYHQRTRIIGGTTNVLVMYL